MKTFKLLLMMCVVAVQGLHAQSFDYDNIAPHPRLLMPKGGEAKIEKLISEREEMARVHNDIMAFCDKILPTRPLNRRLNLETPGSNILGTSRSVQQRIFNLAYAYRMSGDEKYAARAVKEMEMVCSFNDWNPNHFLDIGEMAMALALGYDWLYDYLSPENKKMVEDALIEKAFDTAEETDARFYYDVNNWNSVCNAGFTYAALAIYDAAPEKSQFVLEKMLKTNPLATESFGPDGGYPEGYNYWGYGATFQVLLSAGLESAFGTDNGISQAPGVMKSAYFAQAMSAPSGGIFSFGDTAQNSKCHFTMFWFAKKLGDPSLLWLEQQFMAAEKCDYAANRLMPVLLVFASDMGDIDLDNITPPTMEYWHNRGLTPIYAYRSGWERSDDVYLATKGGSGETSHAHSDVGSFVFEKHGVRWSEDLGSQGYNILASGVDLWGKNQESDRWRIFRLSNQAHSTLVVNEDIPMMELFSDITKVYNSDKKRGATIDMSPAYSNHLSKAERTIYLDANNNLNVIDEIKGGSEDAQIKWVMCTKAQAEILSENQMELTVKGEKMILTVDAPSSIELGVWSNVPPHDYEDKNPDSQRVGFTTSVAAGKRATLKVTLTSK